MASSLDIAPALGHALVTAQGMPGGYDAIDDRRYWSVGMQEGVLGPNDLKVTTSGLNVVVNNDSVSRGALVQGDDVDHQGLYYVAPHTGDVTLSLASSPDVTNPRVDQIVLEARDDAHTGDGITRARLYVLTGTPTAGATLVNRSGATPLPPSTLRLADVLVTANASSLSSRDRRPWATGAKVRDFISSGTASTTGALAEINSLRQRVELSGAPCRLTFYGLANVPGSADHVAEVRFRGIAPGGSSFADLVDADGITVPYEQLQFPYTARNQSFSFSRIWTPSSAGSWLITPFMSCDAGSLDFILSTTTPLWWTLEELVGLDDFTNNGTA